MEQQFQSLPFGSEYSPHFCSRGPCNALDGNNELGSLITSNVAIQQSRKIITDGLYTYVHPPSYTGLLLAVLGLAVSHHNWVSAIIIVVPIVTALLIESMLKKLL